MLRQRNSKKQGDVGLGVAIGWFVEHGHTVSIPLTDSQDYDIVVEIEGELKKVQVKTSTLKTSCGSYVAELRTKGGNRSGKEKVKRFDQCRADLLFVLADDGTKYIIPIADCPASKITLGNKWNRYLVS